MFGCHLSIVEASSRRHGWASYSPNRGLYGESTVLTACQFGGLCAMQADFATRVGKPTQPSAGKLAVRAPPRVRALRCTYVTRDGICPLAMVSSMEGGQAEGLAGADATSFQSILNMRLHAKP